MSNAYTVQNQLSSIGQARYNILVGVILPYYSSVHKYIYFIIIHKIHKYLYA